MSYFPYDKDLKKKKARAAIEVSSLETKKAPAVILRIVHFLFSKLRSMSVFLGWLDFPGVSKTMSHKVQIWMYFLSGCFDSMGFDDANVVIHRSTKN